MVSRPGVCCSRSASPPTGGSYSASGGSRLHGCSDGSASRCTCATRSPTVVDRAKAERSENTLRKDFTPSELLAAGRRIAELERPKAKQRQREGGDHGRQARYSGLGSMEPKPESERDAHKADTAISEALGISRGHYQRLKRIDNATRSEAGYRDGLNGWSG